MNNRPRTVIGSETPTTIPPANPGPDTSPYQLTSRAESPEVTVISIYELPSEPIPP